MSVMCIFDGPCGRYIKNNKKTESEKNNYNNSQYK